MKTAIVTGCPGQDASYLSELLLEKGYNVYGVHRRSSTLKVNSNMSNCYSHNRFTTIDMDITDASGIYSIISDIKPHEYYNLAAMSHVGQSFKEPLACLNVDGYAVAIALEAISKHSPATKFYQASTSELFGGLTELQSEQTPFVPRSPYAAAKLYAHNMVDIYRKSYDIHACCGILFNHESPRRGLDFVTRKITNSIAKFKLNLGGPVELGNLDAMRDWGHAKDYVRAMWMMLQTDTPKDYVVSTGKAVSIKTALQYVCDVAEVGFNKANVIHHTNIRPLEVSVLRGDSSKIQSELGWKPEYDWASLLKEMYESDYASVLNASGRKKTETTTAE